MEFLNKHVCVTGGTRGIGKAIANYFLAAGAKVIVVARSRPKLTDKRVHFLKADVSTPKGVLKLASVIKSRFKNIDILIHNVGGSFVSRSAVSLTEKDWQDTINGNLLPAIRINSALLPSMIENKGTVIIHITALQGHRPLKDSLPYAVAKAALRMYSKGLATEIAPYCVRVLSVCPGYIETGTELIKTAHSSDVQLTDVKSKMSKFGGVPLGRPGRPEEVAELVGFLASGKCSFITGSEYLIDGGASPAL
jgi:NAD(P)-dependent dehydrogenase (short-subunit alcohol dehydrogenase family)